MPQYFVTDCSYLFYSINLWNYWKMNNKTTDVYVPFCLYCALLIEYVQLDRVWHLINYGIEHKTIKYISKLKWNSRSWNTYFNNTNSPASGRCHPHPRFITHLSKKLSFLPHFFLAKRLQQNIKIKNSSPLISNQIDWYDSEYSIADKGSGFYMEVLQRFSHAHWFTTRR